MICINLFVFTIVKSFSLQKNLLDMDDLSKLVNRLETVTSKLEQLSAQKPQLAPKPAHLGAAAPGASGTSFLYPCLLYSLSECLRKRERVG